LLRDIFRAAKQTAFFAVLRLCEAKLAEREQQFMERLATWRSREQATWAMLT